MAHTLAKGVPLAKYSLLAGKAGGPNALLSHAVHSGVRPGTDVGYEFSARIATQLSRQHERSLQPLVQDPCGPHGPKPLILYRPGHWETLIRMRLALHQKSEGPEVH
ncbi:hypothetical protein RRG08_041051 [Elysia crispata]|uniref:Uncharacterized protein n=1 Tax=Elysia crispata TaxID=231223 RepID=A0AAE1CUK9_9GAST|nr:hypothetical protein RRG08_041051 [Elysia crispata]